MTSHSSVLADLDTACRKARERVNRALGQWVRHAKAELAKRVREAKEAVEKR